MHEYVQKGLFKSVFEFSGRVSLIKTQTEKLNTEITNFDHFKSCILLIFKKYN